MAGYDWGRGYGPVRGWGRPRDDYGAAYGSRGGVPGAGFRGRGVGLYRQWGAPGEARGYGGYDRGVYGDAYPSYGGYPGGEQRGMYYGGRGGYGTDLGQWGNRAWGRGMGGGAYGAWDRGGWAGYGGGYDAGYARAPFVPEEAYRRHPELSRAHERARGRWPDHAHDRVGRGAGGMDDEELGQAVRQSLHQDDWIHPDRIQVKVEEGVVTLSGEVEDYMQARYAWDDAWETSGVRGVINNLTVRTDQPHADHGDVVPQTSGGKRKK